MDSIFDKKDEEMYRLFWYWVNERHQIYLKRFYGDEKPWTDDLVLQNNFFTNVFRRIDKATIWIHDNFIEPHWTNQPAHRVIFNLGMARLINLPKTLKEIGFQADFYPEHIRGTMKRLREDGTIFSPAYIITGSFGGDKVDAVVDIMLKDLWEKSEDLEKVMFETNSIEATSKELAKVAGFSGFTAYEVTSDLAYCYLRDSPDRWTWANPGPGCARGISHIWPWVSDEDAKILSMRYLLSMSYKEREDHVPQMEMRDIEHSLCEFGKYVRIMGGGRSKRKYLGGKA